MIYFASYCFSQTSWLLVLCKGPLTFRLCCLGFICFFFNRDRQEREDKRTVFRLCISLIMQKLFLFLYHDKAACPEGKWKYHYHWKYQDLVISPRDPLKNRFLPLLFTFTVVSAKSCYSCIKHPISSKALSRKATS